MSHNPFIIVEMALEDVLHSFLQMGLRAIHAAETAFMAWLRTLGVNAQPLINVPLLAAFSVTLVLVGLVESFTEGFRHGLRGAISIAVPYFTVVVLATLTLSLFGVRPAVDPVSAALSTSAMILGGVVGEMRCKVASVAGNRG
ncbi:hypothetical protein Pyrfu_0353 [Pyrolobus fumarii 1A]|uniref:Uncharacterized protein n=1 Tax=Pyrolobus fumarii (strain DSM 11204 / 1A) TaxID=694429 RepID=G0EFQ4_PYRF1|nr:hypothetical protein [Pyrolobus fumarii]AEM38225.1 hypothetical protein Pyrfu_0353 [Pyrolobus fumarii 1A]